MVILGELFRRYGEQYRARFGQHMSSEQEQAMRAIGACRTEALGGHVYSCPACATTRYSYHSCRNRRRSGRSVGSRETSCRPTRAEADRLARARSWRFLSTAVQRAFAGGLAQPLGPADAVLRPQDRLHFESWNQPARLADLQGGAAHAQAVGRRGWAKTIAQSNGSPISPGQIGRASGSSPSK